MSSMLYVGLDYHVNGSSLCILDCRGKLVKQFRVGGRWPAVVEAVRGLAAEGDGRAPGRVAVAFEACGGCGVLYEQLCKAATRVEVAHPGHLRLIFKSKRKNDRVDAGKLARLLYCDAVPRAHIPKAEVRQWRRLVELRRVLVARRTAVKNQLRGLLRTLGLESPRGLFTRKGMAAVGAQAMDDASALERDLLVEELKSASGRVRRVQKELNRRAKDDARVTLLMTVPGVGARTAEAFVAYVDHVERFGRSAQLGSYFGLVPCQDSSAGRERLGHITREGPASVRWLLVEAAWQAVRKDAGLKAMYERLCGGKDGKAERKKVAIVAVARHLACAMGAMLRTGEQWRSPRAAAA
jgi:transposase